MEKFRIVVFSLLLLNTTGSLYAQKNQKEDQYKDLPSEEKLFALPPFSIKRNYHVDLGRGNQFQIEIGDSSDLLRIQNVDSILLVFLSDLKAFHDSIVDPLTVKRIDYRIENNGQKKLRIRQSRPAASTFLLDREGPAQLRLEQDTIYILMVFAHGREMHYNRFGFFINQYSELEGLVTTGLNDKLRLIKDKGKDPSITLSQYTHDYLQLNGLVNIQNYKNYLTPSVSLGATIHLQCGFNLHDFSAYWQPLFLFSNDAHGQLQTYRNDFVVLRYSYDRSDDTHKKEITGLYTNISIGYLVRREGDFFNKHTFHLSAGDLELKSGKIVLQPMIYFNDFFKGVTPGLRLSFHAL